MKIEATDSASGGGPLRRLRSFLLGVLEYRQDVDGRLVIFGVTLSYLLAIAVSRYVLGVDIWPRLGVPSGPSLFFDSRNVMAALECRRLGHDPLVFNPCDPWDRPLVYPRVWLALRWLGFNQSHTPAFAILLIGLFLGAIVLLVGRTSLGGGTLVAVAMCSPAVMLAIERANMDLAIFLLLTLAVLLWARQKGVLSAALVLAAAIAKIYPVFGLISFLFARSRSAAIAAVISMAAFGGYALVAIDDVIAVAKQAPQGEEYSYGARILIARVYHLVVPDAWQGGDAVKQLIAVIPVGIAALWIWLVARRRLAPARAVADVTPQLLSFYLGSLLFLGTFCLSNNFDYRLVFVLLTLPQLFEWIRHSGTDGLASWASLSLASVLALLWVGTLSPYVAVLDELVTWATAGLLTALLAATIPRATTVVETVGLEAIARLSRRRTLNRSRNESVKP